MGLRLSIRSLQGCRSLDTHDCCHPEFKEVARLTTSRALRVRMGNSVFCTNAAPLDATVVWG